ncbi:MAG TPA: WD40 repeat domain-containing protein, partial [Thermoanaerobaculia bacterium]
VLAAALSPDGSRLATASEDRVARIWDVRSKKRIAAFPGHTRQVTAVSFSADGQRLATASADKTARIWSVATGEVLAILGGHEVEVAAVSLSPDGARLVTASADEVRLWNAETGELLATLPGHEEDVAAASFSPDGQYVLTASPDKTVRRWANPSDYTSFLLGRLRARSARCYNTEEDCEDCLKAFSARLGRAPEDRPESYVEAWRAYRECREGTGD